MTIFNLKKGKLLVGTLTYDRGMWVFFYSPEFKMQDKIKPLTDFPLLDKIYNSKELYPFFISRIPGKGQVSYQEAIKNGETDYVSLLKKFGRRTITNSYILENPNDLL